MRRALDPASGLMCDPNPRARATCPHCGDPMTAKCGSVVAWHWSHVGETCQEWGPDDARTDARTGTGAATPSAVGVCELCPAWEGGCVWARRGDPVSARWRAAWGVGSERRTRDGAPGCPSFGGPVVYGRGQRRAAADPRDRIYAGGVDS